MSLCLKMKIELFASDNIFVLIGYHATFIIYMLGLMPTLEYVLFHVAYFK